MLKQRPDKEPFNWSNYFQMKKTTKNTYIIPPEPQLFRSINCTPYIFHSRVLQLMPTGRGHKLKQGWEICFMG
jgi:hypothetical protein